MRKDRVIKLEIERRIRLNKLEIFHQQSYLSQRNKYIIFEDSSCDSIILKNKYNHQSKVQHHACKMSQETKLSKWIKKDIETLVKYFLDYVMKKIEEYANVRTYYFVEYSLFSGAEEEAPLKELLSAGFHMRKT